MGGFSQEKQQQSSGGQASVWDAQAPFLQQLFGQAAGMSGAPSTVQGPAMGAWQSALSGQINPGVGQVIEDASREMGLSFGRNTMPAIRSGAIGAQALGGSRQGIAEGLAAGELARAQSGMASQMTMQAQDQANRNQVSALGMSGLMGSLPWQNLQSAAGVIGAPTVLNKTWGQGSGSGMKMSVGAK